MTSTVSFGAASYLHILIASRAALTNTGLPPIVRVFLTWPSGVTIASTFTFPLNLSCRARAGYFGWTFAVGFRLLSPWLISWGKADGCKDTKPNNAKPKTKVIRRVLTSLSLSFGPGRGPLNIRPSLGLCNRLLRRKSGEAVNCTLVQGVDLYLAIYEIGFFTDPKLGNLPDCGVFLAPLVSRTIMSPGSFTNSANWSWDGQKILPWGFNRLAQ